MDPQAQKLSESEYRSLIQKSYDRIEAALESVDPDLAECEGSLGSLSIRFADGTKCILSAQPSVRQLWLALAAQGVAYHFNWNPAESHWVDDRGRGVELHALLEKVLSEKIGTPLKL